MFNKVLFSAAAAAGLIGLGVHKHGKHSGSERSECGHGFGRRGFGRRGFGRHGLARRALLWRVLSKIDATPAQEKVIRETIDSFVERLQQSKETLQASRAEAAEIFRAATLEEAEVEKLFARHDEVLGSVRSMGVDALRRIHETLDERQRRVLAELVERGRGFSHHRHGCHHA